MFERLKQFLHGDQTSKKERAISGLLALAYATIAGSYGSWAMKDPYFRSLIKPAIQPPDWAFAVVWPILFVLIGLSGYFVWNHYASKTGRKIFVLLYIINGLLMAAWTDQFVIRGLMTNGLYVLITLVIVIELMIIAGFYTNKKASYLLIPYLGWILFATYLNAAYVIIN